MRPSGVDRDARPVGSRAGAQQPSASTGKDEAPRQADTFETQTKEGTKVSDFLIWVGVDWGSEAHQVCAMDGSRKVIFETSVPHSGEAISKLAKRLLKLGSVETIAVGIETPRGAVVETLLEHGIAVFALNPKQLDRFRDRHTVGGAKDDRRDAFVLADSLRTDLHAFHRVRIGPAELVELRELSRTRDELTAERIAIGHRLREQLNRYFPQILLLGSVYESRWLWELLEMAPTPAAATKLSTSKLRLLLKRYRIRKVTADEVRDVLRSEPLHVAPGVVPACERHVRLLVPRLRLVDDQKAVVEKEIEALVRSLSAEEGKAEHRDAQLLQSLPGLGTLGCATMLSEAWEALQSRDYHVLRSLCGAAPITKQSGKTRVVLMRRACNPRLRFTLHHWVGIAVNRDVFWKARYATMRAAGKSHNRAVRALGDRLLAVLCAVLKSGVPYDGTRLQKQAA